MTHFWDCSIIGDLNNLGHTIDLIKECADLGYFGVVLNYVVDDITSHEVKEALNAFVVNDYEKIVEYFAGKLMVRNRLTLNLVNTKNKHCQVQSIMNNEKNKQLFDKFDIIAVTINNCFDKHWSLESLIRCKQIDVINLDNVTMNSNQYNHTSFKQLIRKSCKKESETYFEISLLSFKKNMKNIIFTVNFIGSVIGKINTNFILSTCASKPLQCRAPNDLLNITNLFNSKFKSNKLNHCISTNIEKVLQNAKINRIAFKKCIESQPITQAQSKKRISIPNDASANQSNDKHIKKKQNTLHSNIGKKKWKKHKTPLKRSKVKSFKR